MYVTLKIRSSKSNYMERLDRHLASEERSQGVTLLMAPLGFGACQCCQINSYN